ncbi:MAG: hypothetical protein U0797_17835 [Gemmataceae bacterium]
MIQEEAIRDAEAVLGDTRARQKAGVVLRDAVLRGQVRFWPDRTRARCWPRRRSWTRRPG